MSVSLCLPHPVAVNYFIIGRGCVRVLRYSEFCVMYVSFGSKVRPKTFGCVAMGRTELFILRSRLLLYHSLQHLSHGMLDSSDIEVFINHPNTEN